MNRLTRDGTAQPVSRDQILRCERGQGDVYFPCSADHEQDWQPYTVDPSLASDVMMTIHKTLIGECFITPSTENEKQTQTQNNSSTAQHCTNLYLYLYLYFDLDLDLDLDVQYY